MFWCDCLHIISCGLFGTAEEKNVDIGSVFSEKYTEVKYKFAIEDNISSDETPSPTQIEHISDNFDFVSPGSDDSSRSPWEILSD